MSPMTTLLPPNCLMICALNSLTIVLLVWQHYDYSPSVNYILSERSLIQFQVTLSHHPARMGGGLFVNSHFLNYQSLNQILVGVVSVIGYGEYTVLPIEDSCLIGLHYFEQFSVLACDCGSPAPIPRHCC